jgi:hypothetical protein
MKVYILFNTNIYGGVKKGMRFCFGVYSTEAKAVDAAKENGFYTCDSEVEIIECEIDNFEEI